MKWTATILTALVVTLTATILLWPTEAQAESKPYSFHEGWLYLAGGVCTTACYETNLDPWARFRFYCTVDTWGPDSDTWKVVPEYRYKMWNPRYVSDFYYSAWTPWIDSIDRCLGDVPVVLDSMWQGIPADSVELFWAQNIQLRVRNLVLGDSVKVRYWLGRQGQR